MGNKKTIITVDDDPGITSSIKDFLIQLHPEWRILEVNSGSGCLKILKKEKVDLLLIDILMPKMDGWELTSKIKDNLEYKKIPIIYLSCLTDTLSIRTGNLIGHIYIEKPFVPEQLDFEINKLI